MSYRLAWGWAPAVAALCWGLAAAPLPAADDFFFKPKDRVVFLGDSITEQYDYTSLIEYYLVTRFPTWDLTFFNAGIGGDTAGGGNGRAARDVLSERPTAVTINFGMNDGGYRAPDPRIYSNYIKNQQALVKKLAAAQVRVALLSTSPVEGRKRKDGETYNKTLETFCEGLKEVAAKHGASHFDQFHPALAVLHKMTADNAKFACFPDSVHTNGAGGLLMAHSILTAMHAPALVSAVTLDARGQVEAARRCKVSDVKAEGDALTFTRLDEALPLAVSPDARVLLPYLDNLAALNLYGLTVTGLPKERYQLSIDGKKVGVFERAQLAKGVNLATLDLGPITAQSLAVRKALAERNQVLRWRFGQLRRGWNPPAALAKAEREQLTALRDQELEVVDRALETRRQEAYQQARPKPHRFELRPAQ